MGAPRSRQTRCAARAERRILDTRPGGVVRHETDQGGQPRRMLRIVHTADVHLGARHDDLGDQASAQRERQFVAFVAAVELAIAEKVDLFLVAGGAAVTVAVSAVVPIRTAWMSERVPLPAPTSNPRADCRLSPTVPSSMSSTPLR